MKKHIRIWASLGLIVVMTACSSVKQELGVGRNSPDEFLVVKRAPLSLPPEYTLRPPEAANIPDANVTSSRVKESLLGIEETKTEKGNADNILLQKTGATEADADIRAKIMEDNGLIALQNKSAMQKLIFWKDEEPKTSLGSAVTVDAKAEAARLEKNKAEGRPLNEGEIPTIERKTSTIDKLFGSGQ